MTTPQRSRRDRPAKPALSREGVVEAARRVMDTEGLDRVTMRRIAQELDTGPASLYVYVANVAELHGAIVDELLRDLPMPAGGGSWREQALATLVAYTELLFAHPGLARSALVLRPSGPNYLRLFDALLGLLRRGKIPPGQAFWGVDLLLQLATATAAEQATRDGSPDAGDEAAAQEAAIRAADPAVYPHLVQVGPLLSAGEPEQRLRWAFLAALAGIAATPLPELAGS